MPRSKALLLGKKNRPGIRPEQLGHDVKTRGEYEVCLGCGRSTKATHIESVRRIFWRRVTCKPVTRMKNYIEKGHE
eukprot:400109-Heterocapsa_arctica.AAC.1